MKRLILNKTKDVWKHCIKKKHRTQTLITLVQYKKKIKKRKEKKNVKAPPSYLVKMSFLKKRKKNWNNSPYCSVCHQLKDEKMRGSKKMINLLNLVCLKKKHCLIK